MNSRLWILPCADHVRRGQGRSQPPAHGLEAIAGSGLTERPRRVESGHSSRRRGDGIRHQTDDLTILMSQLLGDVRFPGRR
jgi:hypothetical protein